MLRVVVIVASVLLPMAALAQTDGSVLDEQLSRAQAAQMIADHGYFEMDDLRELPDGSWRCTALAGPDQRVVVTMDKQGHITETDLPSRRGQ
jgi:hypothetical protein